VTTPKANAEPSTSAHKDAGQGASTRRSRPACVGDVITSKGTPDLDAWASCLTLADLQAALKAGQGVAPSENR
jgi:hypothetical protein